MTDLSGITTLASPNGLFVAGVVPDDDHSIVILSPAEPDFWPHLKGQPEYSDGQPDPIDRWSVRVIGEMAQALGGEAILPHHGPPYAPFYTWALASGRFWASPVMLLVHAEAGLFASMRGAIRLRGKVDMPAAQRPCDSCAGKPCLAACPAGALTGEGYDVPSCHAHLDTAAGRDCFEGGCLVRRACPVGQGRRSAEQSAHHMRHFHK
ncbi:MAG TPA: ferredoxin [Paracoccaceae bacterium]|nr:ferredoxin [Paracoccaceae bacterium]